MGDLSSQRKPHQTKLATTELTPACVPIGPPEAPYAALKIMQIDNQRWPFWFSFYQKSQERLAYQVPTVHILNAEFY